MDIRKENRNDIWDYDQNGDDEYPFQGILGFDIDNALPFVEEHFSQR